MNDILVLFSKFVGIVVALLFIYLVPRFNEWLAAKVDAIEDETVRKAVKTAVLAAEQCLKRNDPTGEIRHNYVLKALEEVGIEITNRILDMIEEEVFSLGHQKHENGE